VSATKLSLKNNRFFKPLIQIGLFLGIFASLQLLYGMLAVTWVNHLLIDEITVKTAAQLISWVTPKVGVQAIGTHLSTQTDSLNIANGCNGLEVMFLLIAAMSVAPLSWRAKLMGLIIGIPYIFILNQVRLMALFYSFRTDEVLFWNLHSTIAPVLLIALTVLFLGNWLSCYQQDGGSIQA
jgi:exosortase family protein XrtM